MVFFDTRPMSADFLYSLDDANPTCVPSDVPIINVVSPKKSGSPLPPRTYRLAETPSAFVERYKKTPPKHRGTITCAPSVTGPPDMPPIASERLGGYFDPSEDDKSLDMKDLGIALQAELNHVHFDTQSMLTQPGKDSADITACFKDPRAAFKASGRKATPHPIKRQTGTEHVNDNDDASGIDGEDDDDKDSDDGGQEEVNSTVDFKTA